MGSFFPDNGSSRADNSIKIEHSSSGIAAPFNPFLNEKETSEIDTSFEDNDSLSEIKSIHKSHFCLLQDEAWIFSPYFQEKALFQPCCWFFWETHQFQDEKHIRFCNSISSFKRPSIFFKASVLQWSQCFSWNFRISVKCVNSLFFETKEKNS